jgi:hypothetical protein
MTSRKDREYKIYELYHKLKKKGRSKVRLWLEEGFYSEGGSG